MHAHDKNCMVNLRYDKKSALSIKPNICVCVNIYGLFYNSVSTSCQIVLNGRIRGTIQYLPPGSDKTKDLSQDTRSLDQDMKAGASSLYYTIWYVKMMYIPVL
jgi:hypothetical protein